jgi:hypothetical protein
MTLGGRGRNGTSVSLNKELVTDAFLEPHQFCQVVEIRPRWDEGEAALHAPASHPRRATAGCALPRPRSFAVVPIPVGPSTILYPNLDTNVGVLEALLL